MHYNALIKDIEDKVPGITNLTTNATLNVNINEVKNEIPNITNLTTNTALTAVENKLSDLSKYVTTPEFKGCFPFNYNFHAGWFFRAENSAWKNIIYFHFPCGQRKKNNTKKHYINNAANLIMWIDMWVVKLDFQR